MPAIPLFAQSCYSLLEGVLTPDALASTAREYGYEALALCDHGFLIGAVEFTLACQKHGIRPILGLEIDLVLPTEIQPQTSYSPRLTLLAANAVGWRNLSRLSSLMQTTQQPIPFQTLQDSTEGVIALTGGPDSWLEALLANGELAKADRTCGMLKTLFKDRLWGQITRWKALHSATEPDFLALITKHHIPLCAVPWGLFTTAQQAETQRTLLAIQHTTRLGLVSGLAGYRPAALIPTRVELQQRFQDLPESLSNWDALLRTIDFTLPIGEPRLPKIPLPPGVSAAEELRRRSYAGAAKIYPVIDTDIRTRLDHELEIIGGMGFEPIFLIMEEALEFARREGIPFSSRGSAASSLVAHCLGITSPDPLKLGLYFERFLNPARTTPPDIDTDIDSNRRDELIQHMFNQYGRENVSMVGTISRFRPKSAVGDCAKACGLSPAEARKLSQELPHSFFTARFQSNDPDSIFAPLRQKYPQANYQEVFNRAQAILGLPRHLSVHPGGIVISPHPTTDLTPVAYSDTKGVTITQFDLDSLEELGLVKLDLLGIRGLSVVASVANAIYSWSRKDYARASDVVDSIPMEDEKTSQLVCAGKTIGCFQIESPGMRSTLKQIQACSIDDILAALALYRPGPMRGGLRDAFIARHNHLEPVTHLHPALAGILADTYGVILYQEQVLRIAHHIAGLSLADSDLLRRAMSHFDPGQQMQLLKEKFIRGADEVSHIDDAIAEQIWEMMAAFAGYGFPKAHAASYAQVAWRSAWCKTYFPAEFIAGVLANWGGYYSQRVYLMEARRLGLVVKPPHINHSQPEFCVSYAAGEPVLYMGLSQVRNLTRRTQANILRRRPFVTFEDFLERADPRYEETVNLVRCGALDGLVASNAIVPRTAPKKHSSQPALFELDSPAAPLVFEDRDRETDQLEILGISVDRHPLEKYSLRLSALHTLSSVEAADHLGKTVRVAGIRQTLHRSRTANGQTMAFLTLEDLEGTLEVVVFADTYRRTPTAVLSSSAPLLIDGVMEAAENTQEPVLRALRITPLSAT